MNRVQLVLSTPAVTLRRFDHPPAAEHCDPEHEVAARDAINFVEDGSFNVRVEGGRWQIGPGSLFVMTRGMTFSCAHDCATPTDRCLSVTYDDRAVEDLRVADVPALRPPIARVSARQTYLRHRLSSCGAGQEIRLELLAGALFESLAETGEAPAGRTPGPTNELSRRVDRAIDLIESDFSGTLTLADLAAAAGLSAFHFARVFRQLTGLPPHRYLMAVRLRQAARLLDQGASVTYACYEVGFGSLSHFITSFRRRFGITPSDAMRGARLPAMRSFVARPSGHANRPEGTFGAEQESASRHRAPRPMVLPATEA